MLCIKLLGINLGNKMTMLENKMTLGLQKELDISKRYYYRITHSEIINFITEIVV
jgi:hypothetical protein